MSLLIDCHTHSNISPDGISLASDMIKTACEANPAAYALTEHCEISHFFSIGHYGKSPNGYDAYGFGEVFEKSMAENIRLKEEYAGKFDFINGIELGNAPADFGLAESVVRDKRLDFVIATIHKNPGNNDFAFIDYSKNSIPELMEEYFNQIALLAEWGKFDVLGHLTYTLRYMEGDFGAVVDMRPYDETIRKILKAIAQKGIGLEINTSGLRQRYKKTFPTLGWIKVFREYGGEIITIGSDAHQTKDIFSGISEGLSLAEEAGFKYVCAFKERKAVFLRI